MIINLTDKWDKRYLMAHIRYLVIRQSLCGWTLFAIGLLLVSGNLGETKVSPWLRPCKIGRPNFIISLSFTRIVFFNQNTTTLFYWHFHWHYLLKNMVWLSFQAWFLIAILIKITIYLLSYFRSLLFESSVNIAWPFGAICHGMSSWKFDFLQ